MPVGAGFIPARIGENKKMTEHKKLQPEIRFAGFTDDWEQRKLGEFSKTTIGEFVIKTKQNPNSKYPVYNGGVSYTGFYDDFNNNGHKIIVSARGANAGFINIINGKYWAGNSCYSIDIQSDNYCIEYVYHFMKHKQHLFTDFQQAANIPSVSKKNVEEFLISYPRSKEEQTQIGNFFKQLDDTIALHQRTLEKYQKLKVSYLEKMFPKGNERYPELRFPNSTDAWEQRKLGDVVEIIGGGTPDTNNTAYWNGNIDWYSPTEIGNKPYVSGSLKKISVLGLQKSSAKILPANKTILFTSRAGIGDMAILTKQGTTNQGFQSFILKNDVDIYFLYSMGFKIKDFALKNASGSTFLEISKSQLSQMKLYLPSLKEQTQIGNFFKQLDDTIALHQREVEKYKKIKQSYLEKMFI